MRWARWARWAAGLALAVTLGSASCGTSGGSSPSYGGNYKPPAGGGTGGSQRYICYNCGGNGIIWMPRDAKAPVLPGGIEICPVCGGSGNAGS